MNPKELVARSYNQMAHRYADWASKTRTEERVRYTSLLLEALPRDAQVLELGCGPGATTTQRLAERFSVTGVDISIEQINLARQNAANSKFICADMCQLNFQPASFDAVAAFYSVIHVPREEHLPLLKSIETWLRPGGLLVATMGVGSVVGDVTEDWLGFGVPMYWSSFDAATNHRLIETAGFHIISAQQETEDEEGIPVTFLWIVAQKPE
jgi:SAM-dependent methyltransferase